ncbi:LOW QUALITY PROTEIN: hypothetical protein PHMEG_00023894 [Phytophthora megakarya]|uniref:Uncharacterized protein n=1 Tax=Phytophthora megakarya TaxID=4795 RepID=A0A225VF08_9STRA|nr:LOW QUALITY PROTEIN: hypothetical protein PHMEG_00023894 [Phytophthora megakarya]
MFTSLIAPRRIQYFTKRHNIVYRKLKKKTMTPKQQSVAYHLGRVKRLFDDGVLDPDQQYNMDGSHFIVDLADGKTLDFCGADTGFNYPIQGLPDAVDGVADRSSPSAFINNNIMQEWLQEVRCWDPSDLFAKEHHLWMKNASGHSGDSVQALGKQLRTHIDFSRLMLLILCNLLIDFQSIV